MKSRLEVSHTVQHKYRADLTPLQNCLQDIKDCLAHSFLELNEDKTEIILQVPAT